MEMRIVSLLPSATEILCLLGLEPHICGVTHECDFPPSMLQIPRVTATRIPQDLPSDEIDALVRDQLMQTPVLYSLDHELLRQIEPDVIVTQSLCTVCAVAEQEVAEVVDSLPRKPRVINLEPTSLGGVLASIEQVGRELGLESRAREEVQLLKRRIDAVVTRGKQLVRPPNVVFLEWLSPLFSAGHWNPELVRLAGGHEMIGKAGARSKGISWEEVLQADPDLLWIACCGFTIERTEVDLVELAKQPGYRDLRAVRQGRVFVSDGSAFFNRPGPRLVDSLEMLSQVMHGEPSLARSVHP